MNAKNNILEINSTDDLSFDPTDPKNETTDQDLDDLTKDHKWTKKNLKSYLGKLRMLSKIHAEIENKITYVEKHGTNYATLFLSAINMPIDAPIDSGTEDATEE